MAKSDKGDNALGTECKNGSHGKSEDFFCLDCYSLVCSRCLRTHKTHEYIDIDDTQGTIGLICAQGNAEKARLEAFRKEVTEKQEEIEIMKGKVTEELRKNIGVLETQYNLARTAELAMGERKIAVAYAGFLPVFSLLDTVQLELERLQIRARTDFEALERLHLRLSECTSNAEALREVGNFSPGNPNLEPIPSLPNGLKHVCE